MEITFGQTADRQDPRLDIHRYSHILCTHLEADGLDDDLKQRRSQRQPISIMQVHWAADGLPIDRHRRPLDSFYPRSFTGHGKACMAG